MEKQCSYCNRHLPLDYFYKDLQKKDGKSCRCKECMKSTLNRLNRSKYEKEYRERNKDRRKEIVLSSMRKNAEHHKQVRKAYLTTPEGIAMYKKQTQKRYALRRGAFIENVDTVAFFNESTRLCFYCGTELSLKSMTIDHYIPLSKGGKHELSNIRVACRPCNLSKGAKMPNEWRPQNRVV